MQENWLELKAAFAPEKRFVLATIVRTSGSTYQKVGTMMLINEQGECSGLLSGGCLEADISFHAEAVFNSNIPKLLNYDLTNNADLLWGLGLGCDGALDIVLQPLTPENNHQSFGKLIQTIFSGESGFYCIDENYLEFDVDSIAIADNQFICQAIDIPPKGLLRKSLVIPAMRPINVLICGAGPDAQPLLNICKQLGWQVSLWDHRQGFLAQDAFLAADEKRKTRAEKVVSPEEFDKFDAAVVMTHNLENDACYLSKMLPSKLRYIGLLGPSGRKSKLFNLLNESSSDQDLQETSGQVCRDKGENENISDKKHAGRVFGPVGLNLGGRGPQAIALSITAQIQQVIIKQRQYTSVKAQIFSANDEAEENVKEEVTQSVLQFHQADEKDLA